jgi:transglutaminase-like putative cysteine protease
MKKRLIWWIVWACVLLAALAVSARAVVQRQSQPRERAFQFRYGASIADLPAHATQVHIWIPLARTRDNQRILSRQIQTSHPYEIHEEPIFGNTILYLALKPPIPQRIDAAVDYEALVHGGRRSGTGKLFSTAEASTSSADELSFALRDEPLLVVNETVTQLAQAAAAGQPDDLAKARAIYDYVITHMSYDKTTPGWGRGDTLRACLLGKGNCTDFHSLFISLTRSVRIPARFVIGVPIPQGSEGEIPGYHCWAEFYSPEHGWLPVDASEAWKHPNLRDYYFGTLDPNRLLISVGRNIQLVPGQAGPPVNMFIEPYVEVDGTPRGVVETRFEFRNRKSHEATTYGATAPATKRWRARQAGWRKRKVFGRM